MHVRKNEIIFFVFISQKHFLEKKNICNVCEKK